MLPITPVPTTAAEAETLLALLNEQRALVHWKLTGMSDADARTSTVPSGTSVLSVVKHLAWMERSFFADDIGGADIEFPWTAEDPDGDWHLEAEDTVASVSRFYVDAINESDAAIGAKPFDFAGGTAERPLSLRFVVGHMIAETARHLGHIDIIREQVDGATGYVPD